MEEHRHLIQELKDELDWAVGEVRRTEKSIMELELDFSQRLKAVSAGDEAERRIKTENLFREREKRQIALRLDDAYVIQNRAARRFALLGRIFETACTSSENLKDTVTAVLFRSLDDVRNTDGAEEILAHLADALHDYFYRSLSDENDGRVRRSWLEVEHILRKLGREM